jgi:glycosyltransferase involved in cell wall biosynthesis
MRVGINLLYLIPGIVGGTETYAAGLLRGLAQVASDDEFFIFVNRAAAGWPLPASSNFTRVVCPITGFNRVERYLYEQIGLPLLLRRYGVDIVHSLGYVGPVFTPCPSVLTVHDANFVDVSSMPAWRRTVLRVFVTLAAKRARVVITVSDFSKRRILETLRLPASKITVIHEAPLVEGGLVLDWSEIKGLYGIREPYLIAFGGKAVHKNVITLIKAFAVLGQEFEHSLVLIGHLSPDVDLTAIEKDCRLRDRVCATGYIPRAHIWPLLSHAEIFVFPSMYEGFGLPVLEAQRAGVPVVCSSAGALPEIAGDGAIYFNPQSMENLVQVIRRVLLSSEMRNALVRKGKENLKRFSWQEAAQQTVAIYRNAASMCY